MSNLTNLPYTFKQANTGNYNNSTRASSTIKYIVVHYTGNKNDTAFGNGNYFANNVTGTSAHYFVDDKECIQSVKDNYIAYHCESRGMKLKCACRNINSIGVEMCTKYDSNYYISEKTKENTIKLVKYLMNKYNIQVTNVIRHYDVCGKLCPEPWVRNSKEWIDFKNKLTSEVKVKQQEKEEQEMVTEGKAVVNGKEYKIDRILKNGNNYIKATNFRNMGFNVGYDEDTKMLKITNSLTEVKINSNGKSVRVRAINVNGYNYISIRELCNILGLEINYNKGEIDIK